jgi:transcriptional regulator with XRE-family HTH domain
MVIHMSYAGAITKARKRAGLSKRKLAKMVGYDASYLTHLEGGDRQPSLEAVARIAKACGVSAVDVHLWADEAGRVAAQLGKRDALKAGK